MEKVKICPVIQIGPIKQVSKFRLHAVIIYKALYKDNQHNIDTFPNLRKSMMRTWCTTNLVLRAGHL